MQDTEGTDSRPAVHENARASGSQSEATLRSVFAALQEGIVVQQQGGAIIHANAAAERILGLTVAQMSGLTSMDPRWKAEHDDGSPFPGETHPAILALTTGQSTRGVIMSVHRPDGTRALIEISSEPMSLTGQGISHAVTTFIDVTARKAAEAERRAAMSRLEDLYQRAPCGYHSLDAAGTFVEVNDTELAWLGVSREEIVGKKSPIEFMTRESRARFEANFPRLLNGQDVAEVEVEFLRPEGGTRRVSVSAGRVTDTDGHFVMSRSVLYDISEVSALRQVLERRAAEMESMLDNEVAAIARLRRRRFVWVNRAPQPCSAMGQTSWSTSHPASCTRTTNPSRIRAGRSTPRWRTAERSENRLNSGGRTANASGWTSTAPHSREPKTPSPSSPT